MKKRIKALCFLTTVIEMIFFIPIAATVAVDTVPDMEEAVEIITKVEKAYDALDIMTRDFDSNPELKKRIKEISYEVRNGEDYKHFDHMTSVYETEFESEQEWMEYLNKTFTDEMSERIIVESNLLFANGKAYLPIEPKQQKNNVISLHEQQYTVPLIDRISEIVETETNNYTIRYYGWRSNSDEKNKREPDESGKVVIVGNPELLELKVERLDSELRVCDYDDVFFIKSDNSMLSAEGKRPYRIYGNNPQTSDAPVIAVCALALSALAAAVVLKKRG